MRTQQGKRSVERHLREAWLPSFLPSFSAQGIDRYIEQHELPSSKQGKTMQPNVLVSLVKHNSHSLADVEHAAGLGDVARGSRACLELHHVSGGDPHRPADGAVAVQLRLSRRPSTAHSITIVATQTLEERNRSKNKIHKNKRSKRVHRWKIKSCR